jgi:hypothetical protein
MSDLSSPDLTSERAVAFPFFARLLGSILSVMFWLIVVGTIVAIVSAIF